MVLDDGERHRQAEPAALVLGGEKRGEDLLDLLGRDAGPVIGDLDANLVAALALLARHLNANRSAARHGFDRVAHQVLKNLRKLSFVAGDRAVLARQIELTLDVAAACREIGRVAYDLHDVGVGSHGCAALGEGEKLPRECGAASRGPLGLVEQLPGLLLFVELQLRQADVADEPGQKVVEVVGDTGGQSANRFQLLHLQLFVFALTALGCIAEHADHAAPVRDQGSSRAHVGEYDAAILVQHGDFHGMVLLATNHGFEDLNDSLDSIFGVDVVHAEGEHFAQRILKHGADGGIGHHQLSIGNIGHDDTVAHGIEHVAEAGLALGQGTERDAHGQSIGQPGCEELDHRARCRINAVNALDGDAQASHTTTAGKQRHAQAAQKPVGKQGIIDRVLGRPIADVGAVDRALLLDRFAQRRGARRNNRTRFDALNIEGGVEQAEAHAVLVQERHRGSSDVQTLGYEP